MEERNQNSPPVLVDGSRRRSGLVLHATGQSGVVVVRGASSGRRSRYDQEYDRREVLCVLSCPIRYASYFEGDIAWPEATDYMGGRYVGTTVEIEQLRPKSPPKFGGGDRTTN